MQIENELRLDFSDVLIRPKRSVLASRGEVNLHREFVFRNSKQKYHGIPIIAANMDTVVTFKMANELSKYKMSVALHKHYSVDELVKFFTHDNNGKTHWYSMGIMKKDLEKYHEVKNILSNALGSELVHENFLNVCLDVANGYQEPFVEFVKKFREENLNVT